MSVEYDGTGVNFFTNELVAKRIPLLVWRCSSIRGAANIIGVSSGMLLSPPSRSRRPPERRAPRRP
jgi:hypothetical protein